jgi:hypothetical protein
VREARREFTATGDRGIRGSGGGHAVQFRATAPSAHTLSEISENGLVLWETSSSKGSPKVQFGHEICPKCATLDKILVQIQALDLGKGPLENVLAFPNLKFSLDEKNLHWWRCSQRHYSRPRANRERHSGQAEIITKPAGNPRFRGIIASGSYDRIL